MQGCPRREEPPDRSRFDFCSILTFLMLVGAGLFVVGAYLAMCPAFFGYSSDPRVIYAIAAGLVTGRELSSAPGEPSKATCMGGDPGKFFEIPVYAGIIHGVHGVCHQMANRLLLTSGRTVLLADGFPLSAATYGIYGTTIPRFVWSAVVWVPPLALALGSYG